MRATSLKQLALVVAILALSAVARPAQAANPFELNFGLFGPTLAATLDNMRRFRDEVVAKVK